MSGRWRPRTMPGRRDRVRDRWAPSAARAGTRGRIAELEFNKIISMTLILGAERINVGEMAPPDHAGPTGPSSGSLGALGGAGRDAGQDCRARIQQDNLDDADSWSGTHKCRGDGAPGPCRADGTEFGIVGRPRRRGPGRGAGLQSSNSTR